MPSSRTLERGIETAAYPNQVFVSRVPIGTGRRRYAIAHTVRPVESRGLIEFRYADGSVVTGDYEQYATRLLSKGDELEYDGQTWRMYDREDRDGVTVRLFHPTETAAAPESSRARRRSRA